MLSWDKGQQAGTVQYSNACHLIQSEALIPFVILANN